MKGGAGLGGRPAEETALFPARRPAMIDEVLTPIRLSDGGALFCQPLGFQVIGRKDGKPAPVLDFFGVWGVLNWVLGAGN